MAKDARRELKKGRCVLCQLLELSKRRKPCLKCTLTTIAITAAIVAWVYYTRGWV